MSEENISPNNLDRIEKEAAEWVIRKDKGFTAEEQDQFFQWLADDPRHGEIFADNSQSWDNFEMLAEWRPKHSSEPNPDLLATIRPARKVKLWSGALALAAVLALVAVVWSVRSTDEPAQTFDSYVIQYDALDHGFHLLEDGSEIDLNEDTELLVAYSAAERRVELRSGEAHFIVEKDPIRPFVVVAGGATVRAVGTAFNVRLEEDSVEVLVTEGRVRMEDSNTHGYRDFKTQLPKLPVQDLLSGQRSIITFAEENPSVETISVETEEMDRLLKWKPDKLDFPSMPLSEAVMEFNKRNDVQIVIADSEIASVTISLLNFRSNNINGFVRLLNMTMAIDADRQTEDEIILYRASQ